jgi:hypothetical protein
VKRRQDSADGPPPGLLAFDGRELTTAADWVEAYDRWYDERDQWETDHGTVLPEKRVLSSCPFDADMIGLPHAGAWSRVRGADDEDETRCGKHNLTPDEH